MYIYNYIITCWVQVMFWCQNDALAASNLRVSLCHTLQYADPLVHMCVWYVVVGLKELSM